MTEEYFVPDTYDKNRFRIRAGSFLFIPVGNEPSGCVGKHLAYAARGKNPAVCCAARWILRQLAAGFLVCAGLWGFLLPGHVLAAPRLQEISEKKVIVIDPGHGGENLGTVEGSRDEKGMTMVTALAMYEELLLYEDVEVYLTHTEDRDMPLKERAEFAAEVEADFLFSIHYNASPSHELFGSEVWVSNQAPYNGYGYQFGCEFLAEARSMGLLIRGVKTRQGDSGDYYGIIRESVARGIPAVIIEHCHVDQAGDALYCEGEEKLKEFGRRDALAVARYFGLKSTALNVDYSGYSLAEADASAGVEATFQDTTEPESCRVDFVEADYETGLLKLEVSARDPDSPLLYYRYSLDGGDSFGPLEAWPGTDTLTGRYEESFGLDLTIPLNTAPEVVVRAYNMYDLHRDSNVYVSPQTFRPEPEPEPLPPEEEKEGVGLRDLLANLLKGERPEEEEGKEEISFWVFLKDCLVMVVCMAAVMMTVRYLSYLKRRKRRRQRRKEARDIWNQHR